MRLLGELNKAEGNGRRGSARVARKHLTLVAWTKAVRLTSSPSHRPAPSISSRPQTSHPPSPTQPALATLTPPLPTLSGASSSSASSALVMAISPSVDPLRRIADECDGACGPADVPPGEDGGIGKVR